MLLVLLLVVVVVVVVVMMTIVLSFFTSILLGESNGIAQHPQTERHDNFRGGWVLWLGIRPTFCPTTRCCCLLTVPCHYHKARMLGRSP